VCCIVLFSVPNVADGAADSASSTKLSAVTGAARNTTGTDEDGSSGQGDPGRDEKHSRSCVQVRSH
jgi:hypothetical protein